MVRFFSCIILTSISLLTTNIWAAQTPDKTNATSANAADTKQPLPQKSQTSDTKKQTNDNSSDADDEAIFQKLNQSQPQQKNIADPLESYNRWMTRVNDHLDKLIAKPLARFYINIIPQPIQTGVNNAYSNLDYIPTIANDILQASLYQATSDSWRFIINSTLGVVGIFDVASHMGLADNHQTFGLTLATWGWDNSSYFVIPILGPSTIRDAGGKPVTLLTSIYPFMNSTTAEWGLYAGSLLNRRVQMLKYQGVMDQASLDRYTFLRNAYLQRQRYLIEQNEEHDIPYSSKQTRYYAQPNYLYH